MKGNLHKAKNIYFIGIGGIGISAIARMLLAEGKKVSGSDSAESEITKALEKLGAKIFIGQKKENIPKKVDLFIYTVAVKKDNPEYIEAEKREVKMLTYAQTLNEISRAKYTIAVAGTHGKTTTTAMIAKILIDAGLDPTVIVGSLIENFSKESPSKAKETPLKNFQTNYISGKSQYFVVEACEYDRSFLNIEPKIAVINNIDNDHLDYYGSLEGVIAGFREFALKVPHDGFIVCDPKDKNVAEAIKGLKCQIIDRNQFYDPHFKMKVFGEHNRRNAGTALSVANLLKVDLKSAKKSLEDFAGTWRRFEYKGKSPTGALVYDDYGHHPTEVSATLKGARELYPDKKIVVVFQPHLFSRTKLLLNDFAVAFADADEVLLAPIFPAREPFDITISSAILAEKIKTHNKNTKSFDNFADIVNHLFHHLKKDNILITMGAGEQYKVGESLLK